ncbi:MAG: hypothetical protein BZ136_09525 [Methanosphaera sp. rholeuAM74]|nr:MAG: hypothetical protein BZ136_09525 [Methanosphaera sp. rholeuAM74]
MDNMNNDRLYYMELHDLFHEGRKQERQTLERLRRLKQAHIHNLHSIMSETMTPDVGVDCK